ncbi:dTMP kinase [Rhizobium sp. OAE497]|uniref:dTMP kinase n=1 Tax=Rhizobium sp. OAE497 TaxID=2663796 RepID=UPI0018F43D79
MKDSAFIVFEGLDGSGTSTQASRLYEYLRRLGTPVALTTEPSSGPIGQQIRSAFSGRLRFSSEASTFDRQMAYLFAADRFDHLNNDIDGILGQLKSGVKVISTRYFFSSFAYHCTSEDDFEIVRTLNSAFPNPDYTIYVDVPVEVSLERLAKRSSLDTYENEEKLRKVKDNYDRIFSSYHGRFLKVDGTLAELDIHKEILEFVLS